MQLQGNICIYGSTKTHHFKGEALNSMKVLLKKKRQKIKRRNIFYCTLSHSVGKPDKEPEL